MLHEQVSIRLSNELAKAKDALVGGHIDSFEKYKYQLGRVHAIQNIIDMYSDIIKGLTDVQQNK